MRPVIAIDADGNERILLVIDIRATIPGGETLYQVCVSDLDGKVPNGISNPVVGPLTYQAAKDAAEKFATDNGYRLKFGNLEYRS